MTDEQLRRMFKEASPQREIERLSDEIDRLQRSVTDWKLEAEVHRKRAAAAVREIARLRETIRRLADQDATLSVVDGNVTVEMDAKLTDAEREACTACVEICDAQARSAYEGQSADTAKRWVRKAATLRGLLERTK